MSTHLNPKGAPASAPNPLADLQTYIEDAWSERAKRFEGATAEEDENGVVHLRAADGGLLLSMSREAWDTFAARSSKEPT